jgi:Mut7-C ubiquitin
MGAATFRFYAELSDFLPVGDRQHDLVRSFLGRPSVKDQIEACGVPHTEVDLILVNGRSVGFDHGLGDGDRVSVYPVFEALDVTPVVRLRPRPLREPRFVLDVHLGKLARRLRQRIPSRRPSRQTPSDTNRGTSSRNLRHPSASSGPFFQLSRACSETPMNR